MASKARSKIYTHLWYATKAEEAAKFYASIFPDSRVDGSGRYPPNRPAARPAR